ncbi:TPA: YjhG/YagF family D-xylonate dehydratase [Candidatus Poribacteria bacterium]|nr:YjhG/YagF family D-xylonate dehydratase [Candidatus Poribacteria bacterium]HIN31298.1 YjhG/YagF family D-xylonate dehydratase [Candidatus Poribacteria bacterium]HIO08696.1 YjhG/YagF family D-xylonate dehydratase [Candidatus Poribacteria bacterium]HIO50449.1 YjhG/YagF family D-xylonate dehydratase [Candidatus Poribacteria bacterium]HIO79345.1 YjhG/YagF family D-xylonate dehydratase [Candidatus Poribacteria bacterium]
MDKPQINSKEIVDSNDPEIFDLETNSDGPEGSLPLTEEMLLNAPSGDIFAMSQNAGMGWNPAELNQKQFLIVSTQGGLRAEDGNPVALGFHTGHWEIGSLVKAAAVEIKRLGAIPFSSYCSDPCDGRTQGTAGMMDSLAFRNDAAVVFRRQIRSLPTRRGVIGIATCDKGLPAMMIALAGVSDLPGLIIPGGVTLPPREGEDAGKIQTIGARFAHGEISLQDAADLGCKACASPGGGCQFLGTAATAQVVAEGLGITLPHAALAPSGQHIWVDMATRSAQALIHLEGQRTKISAIITDTAIRNAMIIHAAFGGSTNLLLHIPAIAHAAKLDRPRIEDWIEINQQVPRIVDVLPNGPIGHPTVQVFLAGGVPEVMLRLRELNVLDEEVMTATGETLARNLNWWLKSERRQRLRDLLFEKDGIDPDDVIMSPDAAKQRGLTSTITFPRGNLAPEGSVIKSTAIDPSVVDEDGTYRMTGTARVFVTEKEAIIAIKKRKIKPGEVMVLVCRGPMGTGMEEVYQITSALKHLPYGKNIALITDARFSGVSTGACIGHIGPEALAGGPIGKVIDGDIIQIIVDRNQLEGSINLVGHDNKIFGVENGAKLLQERAPRPDLQTDPMLPDDTRLWAVLQGVSGGTWGGCVYDVDAIINRLEGNTPHE